MKLQISSKGESASNKVISILVLFILSSGGALIITYLAVMIMRLSKPFWFSNIVFSKQAEVELSVLIFFGSFFLIGLSIYFINLGLQRSIINSKIKFVEQNRKYKIAAEQLREIKRERDAKKRKESIEKRMQVREFLKEENSRKFSSLAPNTKEMPRPN